MPITTTSAGTSPRSVLIDRAGGRLFDGKRRGVELHIHAMTSMQSEHERTNFSRHRSLQQAACGLDHSHRAATRYRRRRHFQPDKTTAQHRDPSARRERFAQRTGIGDGTNVVQLHALIDRSAKRRTRDPVAISRRS
jgi:hypothetical protein